MKHQYTHCQLKGELERRAKFISQFFSDIRLGKLLDVGACKGFGGEMFFKVKNL